MSDTDPTESTPPEPPRRHTLGLVALRLAGAAVMALAAYLVFTLVWYGGKGVYDAYTGTDAYDGWMALLMGVGYLIVALVALSIIGLLGLLGFNLVAGPDARSTRRLCLLIAIPLWLVASISVEMNLPDVKFEHSASVSQVAMFPMLFVVAFVYVHVLRWLLRWAGLRDDRTVKQRVVAARSFMFIVAYLIFHAAMAFVPGLEPNADTPHDHGTMMWAGLGTFAVAAILYKAGAALAERHVRRKYADAEPTERATPPSPGDPVDRLDPEHA
ncbi:MAG: hypothetical protein GC159_05490 [Phycisphaera sp.]|nr:hypothetical protein [Phycisphaera sp.]